MSCSAWPNLLFSNEKPAVCKQTKWSCLLAKEVSSSAGHADGGEDCHNSWWSLFARIYRPWHQNKWRILSRKLLEGALKFGTQIFRAHTLNIPTGLSTIALSTRRPRKVKKMSFLASFPPHNGHQNPRMPIRWTIVPGVFWEARLALKNNKGSISVWWFHWPFEGHNSYQRWPIRTNLN